MRILISLFLALTLTGKSVAGITYDEAVDGDFDFFAVDQALLSLSTGTNIITGTVSNFATVGAGSVSEVDADGFQLYVAPGFTITSISLTASYSRQPTSDTDIFSYEFALYGCSQLPCTPSSSFREYASSRYRYESLGIDGVFSGLGGGPEFSDLRPLDSLFDPEFFVISRTGFSSGYQTLPLDLGNDGILSDDVMYYSFIIEVDGPAIVPVPASAWLFSTGLLTLIASARRRC